MQRSSPQAYWLLFVLRYGAPMAVIQGLDYLLGKQVTLWAFLLLPLGLAAWNRGRREAVAAGAMAAALVLADAWLVGGPYESLTYALIAAMNRCFALVCATALIVEWRAVAIDRPMRRFPKLNAPAT